MAEIIPIGGSGQISDGIALDPDKILDMAKGEFGEVVIVGWTPDGELQVRSSHGSREALWHLTRAIHQLTEGTDG